ncbi:hypothetical protein [Archangium lipolyticum]|uniref:hypothetical protein n=1 Tax=Archangium lipolyticum TaxID=2970465 RepID=UPI00214A2D7E|nr:hypothetical protein [Archangium lipolyticum]
MSCLLGLTCGCGSTGAEVTPDIEPKVSPSSACKADGLLLCDDFEAASAGGAPDPGTWSVQVFQQQGRISVDGTQARSSSKDGARHELRAWFDGNEVGGLHTTNWNANLTSWSPRHARAWFGFETYHGEQDELWYDDVALGTQRIGCDG